MVTQHARHFETTAKGHFNLDNWGLGLPASAHERAAELVRNHECRETAIAEKRRKAFADAAEQYRTRLTTYLGGPDQYYALRHLLREKRSQYRYSVMRNANARESIAISIRSEIDAIIRASGKDPNEIRMIANTSILTPAQVPPTNVPVGPILHIATEGANTGTIPPKPASAIEFGKFASGSCSHSLIAPSDGYSGFKDLTSSATNIIGSVIEMGTGDAGGGDNFEATVDSWLELHTTAGPDKLRIDVEAYGIDGTNFLHTHDEAGISDSVTKKSVQLFVHVMSLAGSTVDELMFADPWWQWNYKTAADHDITNDIGFTGKRIETFTARSGITPFILGTNPVAPFITNSRLFGVPVHIRVGMRRYETIYTDDVSIQSKTDGRVHVASVSVSNFP